MLCSLFSFEENIFLSFLIPDTDSSTNCFLTIEGSEFYFRTIVGGVYTSKSHREPRNASEDHSSRDGHLSIKVHY